MRDRLAAIVFLLPTAFILLCCRAQTGLAGKPGAGPPRRNGREAGSFQGNVTSIHVEHVKIKHPNYE